MANFGSLVVALNANVAGFARGMGQAERILGGFSRTMNSLGSGIALGALGYAVANEVQQFVEFEDAMLRVKAVTGATNDEMKLLSERTHQLAKQSGVAQGSIWQIMLDLGRANFNPQEINSVAEAVVNLTKATGSDPSRTGEILGSMINAFSLGAGDAVSVADKLTMAANKSQTSVEELGDAMAYVGPIGKDIGVTMDETLAMMGVLGNFNIRGSMAGTSTRRLFTLMATDSQRMSEIFGKSFTDINGNFIGVTAAMQLMADATKDMAAPERLAKFNEAFGMLGVASSSTLASMITQYSELKTAITDSTGEAQKQADMMESGVGGSLRRLMATWTEFKTTIITMWADTISNILDTLTGWVTSASDLWNTAQNEASAAFLVIGVAWQWVMDNFHDAATVSTGVVIMAITFLGDTCYNTFMWIKDVAVITSQNLGDAFGTVLSNTIENFKILGRNIREVFVSVWDYIKNIGKSRTFELAFEPFKAELDGLVTRELPKFENKASFVTDMVANKVKESLDNLDKRASLGDQIDAALQELQAMQGGKLEPKAQWDPTKTPADRGNQFSPRTTPAPTDTVKTGATAQIGLQGTAKAYEIIMKARNDKHTKLLEKIAENTGKTAEPVRPGFEGAIAEGLM
jgi:TP901 family phage tail tape measure protein